MTFLPSLHRSRATLLIAALLALATEAAAQRVPLPRARPADAPQAIPLPRQRPADAPQTIPLPPLRPAILPTPTEPPPPSACQIRLPDIATVEIIPPVIGANGCGIDDAVKLSAVTTRENGRIAIAPPATLRCSTAEAIAHWLRDDVAPIAATLGAPLAGIANFAAYECRGRNRIVGALISEHGKGNALDIRALTLANGKHYEPTDVAVSKDMRERLKASACARFSTVLGPSSDGYHENHIHVDLAERRSGYRICQWAVRDAFEPIPLPRERPPEAPR